jgi:2-polyprenyl-3-methyl-5-hydroxy-6-metoxy-1,4-benzoquinol methylase
MMMNRVSTSPACTSPIPETARLSWPGFSGAAAPTPELRGAAYWEARARRYAAEGTGLAAVCSYGMPGFYNRAIDFCQTRALAPWLRKRRSGKALDVGCGIGRWSVALARLGMDVTAVDISPTMLSQARQRAERAGVACRFQRGDIAKLEVAGRFDLIFAVTVVQHVLGTADAAAAVQGLADRLAPGGELVMLEVAPTLGTRRCDTAIFEARSFAYYEALLRQAGLTITEVRGVDPVPLKKLLLPFYRSLPRPLARLLLALATLVAFPVDWCLGWRLPSKSWHKVIVARRADDAAVAT